MSGTFLDENFARELMQLFIIGLWELNEDGSHKKMALDNSIPSDGQDDIDTLARVWTGFDVVQHRGYIGTLASYRDIYEIVKVV